MLPIRVNLCKRLYCLFQCNVYLNMRLILLFSVLFNFAGAQTKTIHVVVALCDNKYQGIVPVPAKIGNGQDPANNLYWGCGYGVKTFFKKQPEWKLVKLILNPDSNIYERVIFKHKTSNTYLIADAYDGAYIKKSIRHFLNYAAGRDKKEIKLDDLGLKIGGNAELVCFVGHNGLMDFELPDPSRKADEIKRDVGVFCCASKSYFTDHIKETGAYPLIWTSNLMCPEAYTLHALVNSWIKKDKASVTREKVAASYTQYHKCGMKGAMGLFVTGF